MALSPEELAQIREVVKSEVKQALPWAGAKGCLISVGVLFLVVLVLHVVVIGCVVTYYLLHPQ